MAAAAQDQSPTQQTAGGSPTVNAGSSAHESLSGPGLDEHSVSIASRRSKRDKQHRHGAQRLHRGDDELEVSSSQIRESARGVTNPVTSQPAVNLQRHGVPTTISCETVYSEDNTLYTSASAAIIRKLQLDVQAAEAKAKAAEEAAKVAQDEAKAAKEEATALTAIPSCKPTMNEIFLDGMTKGEYGQWKRAQELNPSPPTPTVVEGMRGDEKNVDLPEALVEDSSTPAPSNFPWANNNGSCGHGGCTGCSSNGGGGAATASKGVATPPASPTSSVINGSHVRGFFAAESPSTGRSGGLNLDSRSLTLVSGGSVGVSFMSPEAAQTVRDTSAGVECGISDLEGGMRVKIRKDLRTQPGDEKYMEQLEKITRFGDYALKESEKFGGWDYEAQSESRSTSSKTTHAADTLKAFKENNARLRKLEEHIAAYDLTQPIQIFTPRPGIANDKLSSEELFHSNLEDLFDISEAGKLSNLLTYWAILTPPVVALTQRVYNSHAAVFQQDKDSNKLLYQAVWNSLTTDFQKSVKRVFDREFKPNERGGITFLYTVLNRVFKGTAATVDALHNEFEKFRNRGPSFLPNGENIGSLVEYLTTVVINPIASMGNFDRRLGDPIEAVYTGLSKSSCDLFATHFQTALTTHMSDKINSGSALAFASSDNTDTVSQHAIADKILDILEIAHRYYDFLIYKDLYKTSDGKKISFNSASGGGNSYDEAFVKAGCTCFNCGGPHRVRSCPKDRNEAVIAKNREAYNRLKKDQKGGSKSGGGIPERDSSGDTGGGGDENSTKNSKPKEAFMKYEKDRTALEEKRSLHDAGSELYNEATDAITALTAKFTQNF